MLKFCIKESSKLIGLENCGTKGFSIAAGLGWYSTHQSKSNQISTHHGFPHPIFYILPMKALLPLLLLEAGNQTFCFESFWTCLTTSTWNGLINVLLLLFPYHMQRTNFITQLILDSKLTHYLSSLWACSGMPEDTHLNQSINI